MEDLFSQFTFLSDQALQDKTFDPSSISSLVNLFEVEAYKAWAALELEHDQELAEAEDTMIEAEHYLDSVMESAMEEFRQFEAEMEREGKEEFEGLVKVADAARKMGRSMEKAASFASKKYVEAALNSATNSVKSAWKGMNAGSNKVHPD